MSEISLEDFQKVQLRVGTVIEANNFPQARNPAYILKIDFGDKIGVKKSSAQITDFYTKEELLGKKVVAVINIPPKQIGPIKSECLVTGFYNNDGKVILAIPDKDVPDGAKLA